MAGPTNPPGIVGNWRGPNLLVDGDMDAVGVGAWTSLNANLAKLPATDWGQYLRVTSTGSINTAAYQTSMVGGLSYRLTGRCRSDTLVTAKLGTNVFTYDIFISTLGGAWEYFDATFVALTTNLFLRGPTPVGLWSDFDNLYLSAA